MAVSKPLSIKDEYYNEFNSFIIENFETWNKFVVFVLKNFTKEEIMMRKSRKEVVIPIPENQSTLEDISIDETISKRVPMLFDDVIIDDSNVQANDNPIGGIEPKKED
jgi:hypothetical protein